MPAGDGGLPLELFSVIVSYLDAKALFQWWISFSASSEYRSVWTRIAKEVLRDGFLYWQKTTSSDNKKNYHLCSFLSSILGDMKQMNSFSELCANTDLFLIQEHLQFAKQQEQQREQPLPQWPISCQNVYFGQGRYAKLVFTIPQWSPKYFGFRCVEGSREESSQLIGKVFIVDGIPSFKTCRVFGYHLSYSHGSMRARIIPKEDEAIQNYAKKNNCGCWLNQNKELSFFVKWTTDPHKELLLLQNISNNYTLLRKEIAHRTRIFCEFQKSCDATLWKESGIK